GAESRALDHRERLGVEPHEPKLDAALLRAPVGFREHLERRVLEVEDAGEVERDDLRLHLLRELPYLLAEPLRVHEEEAAFEAHEEEARERLVVRVLARDRPEDVRPALPPEDAHGRIRDLVREAEEGDDDRDEDALERPEENDAEERRDRPEELHPADPQDR